MVGIDIGDDREHRLQVHERRIALVSLGDQVFTLPQPRIRIGALEPAADDESRVEAALGKHTGDEARGRRLPVGAGDRDRIAEAHQFREHLRSRHHRHQLLARGGNLRIGFIDRAGDDNRICIADVFFSVADEYGSAQLLEAPGLVVRLEVRTLHVIAEIQHHLGNSRHARTAYADKVDALDTAHSFDHAGSPASCRQSSVMRCRA